MKASEISNTMPMNYPANCFDDLAFELGKDIDNLPIELK